jgi:hypothetical protein
VLYLLINIVDILKLYKRLYNNFKVFLSIIEVKVKKKLKNISAIELELDAIFVILISKKNKALKKDQENKL